MKVLLVGDVHGKASDLEDCRNLIRFVRSVCEQAHPDRVLFLGDQYHTHAVVNVHVMEFWKWAFKELADWDPIALVGNHDMPGIEGSYAHSMMLHETVQVVMEPTDLCPGVLMLPYIADSATFIQVCEENPATTVICHQEFNGCQYENGFYSKHGVELNLVPQKHVISGHIHAPQAFGKVWYPGAPRWQTLSDANTERKVWLVKFAEDGSILDRTGFDTGTVCRKIYHQEFTPDNPPTGMVTNQKDVFHVDLKGPQEFIDQHKDTMRFHGARVRTFKTDTRTVTVKESEGVQKAFQRYLASFSPPNGTPTDTLEKMYAERIGS